ADGAVDAEPALQVRHRDAELVEGGQRLGAPAVPDGDGEGRLAGPEQVRRLPGDDRERRPRPGREEGLVPALQRADEIRSRHAANLAVAAPPGSGRFRPASIGWLNICKLRSAAVADSVVVPAGTAAADAVAAAGTPATGPRAVVVVR